MQVPEFDMLSVIQIGSSSMLVDKRPGDGFLLLSLFFLLSFYQEDVCQSSYKKLASQFEYE